MAHIKKPLNAFMLFMKEQRANVAAECTLKESAAINQILGRRVSWGKMFWNLCIELLCENMIAMLCVCGISISNVHYKDETRQMRSPRK